MPRTKAPKRPAAAPPAVTPAAIPPTKGKKIPPRLWKDRKWCSRISKTKKAKVSKVTKGMENTQSTCYRNSLLQCLIAAPAFYDMFKVIHASIGKQDTCQKDYEKCIPCALGNLVEEYWDVDHGALAKPLRSAINSLDKAFANGLPNDNEFGKSFREKEQCDAWDCFDNAIMERLGDTSEAMSIRDEAFQTFFGPWKQICPQCGNKQEDKATAMQSLGISLNRDSAQLRGTFLKKCIRDGLLSETRAFDCPSAHCQNLKAKNGKVNEESTRTREILKLPEILVIRFEQYHTGAEVGADFDAKNKATDAQISPASWFEEFIDMGEYCADEEPKIYKLCGVVSHRGPSVASGHYIAGVRKADGKTFAQVNDSHVIDLPGVGHLQKPVGSPENEDPDDYDGEKDRFTPYIVVYNRI